MDLHAKQAEALRIREQVLSEVGLGDARGQVERLAKVATDARKRGAEKRKADAVPLPQRRSTRVMGLSVDGNALPDRPAPVALYTPEAPRVRPEGDVPLLEHIPNTYTKAAAEGVLAVLQASAGGHAAGPAGAGAAASPKPKGRGSLAAAGAGAGAKAGAGAGAGAGGRSVDTLAGLQIQSEKYVMKGLPGNGNRVYSIGFHPTTDKLISIIGGRFGELSLWCPDFEVQPMGAGAGAGAGADTQGGRSAKRARREGAADAGLSSSSAEGEEAAADDTAQGAGAEEDEDDPQRTLAVFNFHSSVINAFKVPPQAQNCLVTTSYDGTIRVTDLYAHMSYQVADDEGLPSAIDIDTATGSGWAGGFTFFVGTRAGTIFHLDTRLKASKTSFIEAHTKKITAVSLSAAGGPYLCSSSGDATVKIWDARKLPVHKETGGGQRKGEPIETLQHGASVTSTQYSASGSKILTCSNDNKLRVYNISGGAAGAAGAGAGAGSHKSGAFKAELASGVYHNNHTGRWLSPFKCCWDPAGDDTYLIGDMTRGVNLYSAAASASGDGRPVATLGGELLTAVPTQVAAHPTLNAVVGGTASGRVYMWT